jgi:hypothetical protein
MTDDQLERFDSVAYSYRSWPATDPAGVVKRFNELVALVSELIEEAERNEHDAVMAIVNKVLKDAGA